MPTSMSAAQTKVLTFAIFGAAGCFVAALIGEVWMALTLKEPEREPLAVCLVLDCSNSMSDGKLDKVKAAATGFVERHENTGDEIALLGFGTAVTVAAPLTTDHSGLRAAIDSFFTDGTTNMSEALQEGLEQLQGSQYATNLLLFTDGEPDNKAATLIAAADCRDQDIKIVAVATGDADITYMGQLTGDPSLVIPVSTDNFETAFKMAEKKIFGRQLAESTPTRSGVLYAVIRMGIWTALLAIGISLAVIIGQNHYLQRPLLDRHMALTGSTRGLAAGLIAGALSQLVFSASTDAPAVVVTIVRIFAWAILGGLLGLGLAMFVDNLKPLRGMAGGAIGGAAGAILFILVGMGLGDIVGRPVGAASLGLSIGAMIALVDAFFREAWVEVHYGPNEMRTVALGSKPIAIGSNREFCTVIARGSADVALRFTLTEGRISCEDVPAERTVEVMPGDRRSVGNLDIVVCAARPTQATTPRQESGGQPFGGDDGPGSSSSRSDSLVSDADFHLCIRGRRIPLSVGFRLGTTELAGLETTEPDGAVAEVTAHPSNPDMLGLKNLSKSHWKVTMPDGSKKDIAPGQNMRLAADSTIDFGVITALLLGLIE